MIALPPLRAAFWNYDRTLPLVDGRVKVPNHELQIEIHAPEALFGRVFTEQRFDVTELSFSNSVTLASKGELAYACIPVFLSRAFRHSSLYVRTDRGIQEPRDLKGKTIGLQEYDMTAAVVVRGFLRDCYGVDPRDIHWKVGERGQTRLLNFPLGEPPDGLSLEILPPGRTLESRFLDGEVDAIIVLRPLTAFQQGDPRIARLFPDPVSAEKRWYSNQVFSQSCMQ